MLRLIDELFEKYQIEEKQLIKHGFINIDDSYIYNAKIHNNEFELRLIFKNNKLDGSLIELSFEEEYNVINSNGHIGSFNASLIEECEKILIDIRKKCASLTKRNYWIAPANPKYYDVTHIFDNGDLSFWKPINGIAIGDILFIYVTQPFGKLFFKCEVTQINVPTNQFHGIKELIYMKLLERLDDKNFNFEYLNNIGVKAIRGARRISEEMYQKIK